MGTVCAVGEAELSFIRSPPLMFRYQQIWSGPWGALASHLDVVGVSDQLIDVGGLGAQLGRVVLQDDAFAGAAVQTAGRFLSCCT